VPANYFWCKLALNPQKKNPGLYYRHTIRLRMNNHK
jgi:hypothetical protein